MANFKIIKGEQKKYDWGIIYKCDLTNDSGEIVSNVSVKSSFPNFSNLSPGQIIEGEITKTDKGYSNLSPMPTGKPAYGARGTSSGAITKAMEKKEASIEKFQDSKEFSIKVSSTMRDAVLLAIAEYSKNEQTYPLDELVVKWRHWLWLQWDKTSPDEIAPF